MKTRWTVVSGEGMGNFLNPPNHAEHKYSVKAFNTYGQKKEQGSMSLRYAAGDETPYLPPHIKERCHQLLASEPGQYTDKWERTVYSYFKHCYSPDGITRNVSSCIVVREGTKAPAPERHLAYLFVRSFFPDAKPRLDLIENPPDDYGKESNA